MQTNSEKTADIGLIGLAVMGQNLVLNMNDHGYTVAVYNRTVAKVEEFLNGPARGTRVLGAHSLEELTAALKRPRKVMLMVKAGQAVDDFIDRLLPHLEAGDLVAILDQGAYCESVTSDYCAIPIPATVLASRGRAALVRRRETVEDLVARFDVPDWLD